MTAYARFQQPREHARNISFIYALDEVVVLAPRTEHGLVYADDQETYTVKFHIDWFSGEDPVIRKVEFFLVGALGKLRLIEIGDTYRELAERFLRQPTEWESMKDWGEEYGEEIEPELEAA